MRYLEKESLSTKNYNLTLVNQLLAAISWDKNMQQIWDLYHCYIKTTFFKAFDSTNELKID